jgi:hypothetical protein
MQGPYRPRLTHNRVKGLHFGAGFTVEQVGIATAPDFLSGKFGHHLTGW